MNLRIRKKLLNDIHKLPRSFHEQIFEKLLNHDINLKYNSNSTRTYIDLGDIDDEIIDVLINFVKLCYNNIEYNKQHALLYKKAEENINEMFVNDYSLHDVVKRSTGEKLLQEKEIIYKE